VNGEKVGATESNWRIWLLRSYPVPAACVKAARTVIAVPHFRPDGQGGFYPNYPDPLKLSDGRGNELNLSAHGNARLSGPKSRCLRPFGLPEPTGIPTAFYNAMVAPFTSYPLRGFIWYQGEGNAGAAKHTTRSSRP
jgi:sialate O-acetylesterase